LANLDFCEQQYFLNYNLGIPRKAGIKAAKGTTVHKVLECLALMKLECQKNVCELLTINDAAVGKIIVAKDMLHNKALVNELVQKSFNYYSKQDGNNFCKKDFNDIESWVYAVLWYKDGMFDPRQRDIVAAEPHFDIEIDKPWAEYHYKTPQGEIKGKLNIKGTVDLITKVNEKTIEIIDWKTGQRKNWATGEQKTYEKLCQDPQLMLYYYAACKMYPWADNIILTIFYVKDGGPFTICFEPKHIEQVETLLHKKFEYVQKNKMPKMVSSTQSDFRCTKICDYFKNNWPGTKVNQCRFIHEKLKKHGMEYVEENFKDKLHSIDHYTNPGE
jgi:ATP-dependent helicase/DNAse subunit B